MNDKTAQVALLKEFSRSRGDVCIPVTPEGLQTPISCLFLPTPTASGTLLAHGLDTVKGKVIQSVGIAMNSQNPFQNTTPSLPSTHSSREEPGANKKQRLHPTGGCCEAEGSMQPLSGEVDSELLQGRNPEQGKPWECQLQRWRKSWGGSQTFHRK